MFLLVLAHSGSPWTHGHTHLTALFPGLLRWGRLVAWHSGRTSVSGRRTFRPALDLQLTGDH